MLQPYNPKNENIKIWVGDKLYPRNEAKVSVFDSSVQGGDAVWEGLRVYKEGIIHLDRHLERMYESAKSLAFTDIPTKEFIKSAIKATLNANGMEFQQKHLWCCTFRRTARCKQQCAALPVSMACNTPEMIL